MNEVERSTYITKLAVDNPNHSLRIGGEGAMPFIVIGSGITADFIYPILDIQHAVPNPDKECIIFGNDHTYDRVFDSYRGNPTENYLVGKFNDGVDPQKTIDAINAKAKEEMNWPKGIKAAYLANDTTDFLNAGAFRIAYIPQLVNRVQYISYALTTFIVILSLFICGIVIRRFVSNNRMQIGVMQANGIKKSQIAFSLTPFALIPAIIGGIGGYIAGLLLQSSAMGLFSNYWMLPTAFASFNILSFLVALLIPFAIFMVVAIISTLIVLREKTVDLMKQGSEYKSNAIARNIKKPFVNFGIMTKFRVSLAFNSF
jgi:putative ABC transport system permease protein